MSKHPNNPYWHDASDRPILLTSQHDWDDALASDYLTPEHVVQRLELMLEYEFGNGVDLGYNEEGFLNSLTAAGTRYEGGLKMSVYPEDHDPPHVHVEFKSNPNQGFRLELATGNLMSGDTIPSGGSKKLKRAQSLLAENGEHFRSRWDELRPG